VFTNMILIRVTCCATTACGACWSKRLQTRLLANCLRRLTVGTAGDNTHMLAALKASL
jgi:hypothetical protein